MLYVRPEVHGAKPPSCTLGVHGLPPCVCLQVVWANITKAVLDCGFGNIIGQRMCMATSDAGQRTNAMHGAVRKTGYIGVPEKVWAVSAFPEPTHRTAPDLAFFAF